MSTPERSGGLLHVVRAHWLAAALVAAASVLAAGALVISLREPRDDQPSGSFCLTFENPTDQVDRARQVLTGGVRQDDGQGDTERGAASIVWSERTAAGAPDDLEDDAQVVAAGMRRALIDSEAGVLDEPDFLGALARLERAAPAACSQVEH